MSAICQALWRKMRIPFIYYYLGAYNSNWFHGLRMPRICELQGETVIGTSFSVVALSWSPKQVFIGHHQAPGLQGSSDGKANPCSGESMACIWHESDNQDALGCICGGEKEQGLGSTEEAPKSEWKVQRVRYSFQNRCQELQIQTIRTNLSKVRMLLWIS